MMKNPVTISECVEVLRADGIVAIPTETVYGLAADARSSVAVAKIFALKGRPSTNPLIVHVVSVEVGERYAIFDERARRLFAAFAPGPLTIVLRKREDAHGWPSLSGEGVVCDLVSVGLNTVGIRIPVHPLALELLRMFDGPLAAPSANKSNHISPTTAAHVRAEFGDDLPLVDGGPCAIGVESTVLDLSRDVPTILRPGAVTRVQIESVIGPVDAFAGHVEASSAASSPGQQERHYAPRARAWRFDRIDLRSTAALRAASSAALLCLGAPDTAWARFDALVSLPVDPSAAAARLYAALRELDAATPTEIFVEMPPDLPAWTTVRDRITRATTPIARRPG